MENYTWLTLFGGGAVGSLLTFFAREFVDALKVKQAHKYALQKEIFNKKVEVSENALYNYLDILNYVNDYKTLVSTIGTQIISPLEIDDKFKVLNSKYEEYQKGWVEKNHKLLLFYDMDINIYLENKVFTDKKESLGEKIREMQVSYRTYQKHLKNQPNSNETELNQWFEVHNKNRDTLLENSKKTEKEFDEVINFYIKKIGAIRKEFKKID